MKIKVMPNAKSFSCMVRDGLLCVRVPAKAVDGGANKELVRQLEKKLDAKVIITAGLKSREKEITISGLSETEALKKLVV